ncbi:MAG: translation initiation factor IF-2 [Methanosarcinales archaeon]
MVRELRTPIVSVMGHVDHGKTTLLDRIRGTAVAEREDGLITQHIGATEIPIEVIQRICGKDATGKITLPGLLFIDTPGHRAFTTLRSRGGALADIAVLIVDINEGFKPQTIESLNILRDQKTPFLVAANKIDRLHGWVVREDVGFHEAYSLQAEHVRQMLDTMIYELIGKLYEHGFSAERYDRIKDFQKNIAVVPISAKTGEGLPDLLMVLLGLSQRFLERDLSYSTTRPGVGTILEVKEEVGLGTTLDIILYDGRIEVGDSIAVGGMEGVITSKVRALLKPAPLSEIRSEEGFLHVKKVIAAAGVKIVAPNMEGAVAGAPLRVIDSETEYSVVEEMQQDMKSVLIETESTGVTIKADTLGSLEAIVNELKRDNIPIRRANIGDITKKDVIETNTLKNEFYRVIIGFNVKLLPDAKEELEESDVKLFLGNVIYRLIEDYGSWVEEERDHAYKKQGEVIVRPGRFKILPHCIFRQSKPAVVGVQVLGGVIKTRLSLIKEDGRNVGVIKGLQDAGENISEARYGDEVAVAIDGPVVGRQIKENEILYVDIPEHHSKIIEFDLKDNLSPDEYETFEDFLAIKRRNNPFWGK